MRRNFDLMLAALLLPALCGGSLAGDWPEWGGGKSKNMAAEDSLAPDSFDPGKPLPKSGEVDLATSKNVKWAAKLGSQTYGNVTVANGKVFVGTNNEPPRDPRHEGDRGILLCLDEATGKLLWQLVVPKLGTGSSSDFESVGICSSPAIDGDCVYVVTNRCEAIALDIDGQSDGNDGPFKEEASYMTPSKGSKARPSAPLDVSPLDADILWRFDMREELGLFPHNIASSSILPLGNHVYVTTSNGQDWTHTSIPFPYAPALICLDKKSGKLLGEEASGISQRMFHCNWSSPSYGEANGKGMVLFGGGDGFCYAFDPTPVHSPEKGTNILKELWRFDCNPPGRGLDEDGKLKKYPDPDGPSEVLATPVFYNNHVYASVGQDPENGEGVGCLSCIDARGSGDISSSGAKWKFEQLGRSMSTVSIGDGLLYVGEYAGKVHCLDANTGELYWTHDTQSHIWGSTLLADGKVFVGDEDGAVTVLASGKEYKVLQKIQFDSPIYSTPVAANDTLYISTQTHLYAISAKAE